MGLSPGHVGPHCASSVILRKTVKIPIARTIIMYRITKVGLLILTLSIIYSLMFKANTTIYFYPLIVAFPLTWLAWISTGHLLASFSRITVLFFFLFYPFSAFLNSLLPVNSLIFHQIDYFGIIGLWAYCLGIFGMICGFIFIRKIKSRLPAPESFESIENRILMGHKVIWVIFFIGFASILLSFLGSYYGGYYHHDYTNFESAKNWFFVGYFGFVYFAMTAILGRIYLQSKKKLPLVLFVLLIISLLIVQIPSARRAPILMPLSYISVYLFSVYESHRVNKTSKYRTQRTIRKLFYAIIISLFMMIIISVIPTLQGGAHSDDISGALLESTTDQINNLFSLNFKKMNCLTGVFGQVAYRVQEFGWAGKAINVFSSGKLAWFAGWDQAIEFVLPSFLRVTPYWELEGVQAAEYLHSDIYQGLPPLTTIGDLYRRFSWPGIFFGMFFLAILLSNLDYYFQKTVGLSSHIHFLMFWFALGSVPVTLGVQEIFVRSFRPFVITAILAFILSKIIKGMADRKAFCRRL